MVVQHNDSINNIHYKLGLNIYIGSYTIVIAGSIDVVEYFEKNIMNNETIISCINMFK